MKKLLVSVLLIISANAYAETCGSGYQPFGMLGALLNHVICESTKPDYTNNTRVTIPSNWEKIDITPANVEKGWIINAKSNQGTWILISGVKKGSIDPFMFVEYSRKNQSNLIEISEQTEPKEITVDGHRAWTWETQGKNKNLHNIKFVWITTVVEGSANYIVIDSWVGQANPNLYARAQDLRKLPSEITIVE